MSSQVLSRRNVLSLAAPGFLLAATLVMGALALAPPASGHISVSSDPWTYESTSHTSGDAWNWDYIADPVNIVFYGSPDSTSAGKAPNAVLETIAHLAGWGSTGGTGQHAHIDASYHGGGSSVPVSMYGIQLSYPRPEASDRMHARYFESTYKDTHTYGWFTLSDFHDEWVHYCSEHWYVPWHHVNEGGMYTSGFETAEAYCWQEFYSHGHSYLTKDLDHYSNIDVGHGKNAVNTRYAHYIRMY